MSAILIAAASPIGMTAAFGVLAEPYAVQQGRLTAPDAVSAVSAPGAPMNIEAFGAAVAIDGDTAVVGAPEHDIPGSMVAGPRPNAGKVYVYVRSGTAWALQAELLAPSAQQEERFGTSVAIQGNVIVIGSPGDVTARGTTGAAYVSVRTGTAWGAPAPLPTELSQSGDKIGQAVDIDGDTIAVGCPGDSSGNGCVRIFTGSGSTWSSGGGIELNGAADDHYGEDVAVSGDSLMVSASGFDSPTLLADAGSVVVFSRVAGTWLSRERVMAPASDWAANARFGAPLDLSASGSTLLVGAPTFDASPTSAGRAYIYNRDISGSYIYTTTLTNPGPNSADGDWFGSSVALDGDRMALVGAFWDDEHTGSGYFYTWRGGAWSMVNKIDATSLPVNDPGATLFGAAVDINGGTAIVGATLANATPSITQSGAAYVFSARGVLTGICRDKLTGAPLANVEVSAYIPDGFGDPDLADGTSLTTSDGAGRYTLYLNSGSYAIGYMGLANYWPGFHLGKSLYPDATPVTVVAGSTTNLDLLIRPKLFIHRFYNVLNGSHFFTPSDEEKAAVIAKWPNVYTYEGVAYAVNPDSDLQWLYRCYNKRVGSHFYTASYEEAIGAQTKWPSVFQYEGPTYPVSAAARAGSKPVYRFYNLRNGSHFYTASPEEADHVIATWPNVYKYEGPAFWISR